MIDDQLGPLWREYWQERWHKVSGWSLYPKRYEAFLTAEQARTTTPSMVVDAPTGRCPFLGVVTIGPEGEKSDDSGIIQFAEPGHLVTIAPTRTGKGTAHIIPNLLLYGGSAVVLDIKGENYDISAERRAKMFPGARVVRFAPFDARPGHRYNPLDFIRVGSDGLPIAETFDDARLLTEMLLPGKGKKEEYWDIEAQNLLMALILYITCLYKPGDHRRNMKSIVQALYQSTPRTAATPAKGFELTIAQMVITAEEVGYEPLRALAGALAEHEEKVRAGIVSTCRAEMKVWLSDRLQEATAQSDFSFSELKSSMCRPVKDNPAPTTLYIIIPPEYLRVYRSVVRMMIGLAVVELTRPPIWADKEGWRTRPPGPVLFFLDELPALGHMRPIVEGLSFLAGYDVQLWTFAQNIGQLKDIYGEAWQNFPANSGATSFFGVNDPDTAEYIERLLGETSERLQYYRHDTNSSTLDFSRQPGQMHVSQSGSATSHRFVKEKVISAAEIRALPDTLQVVFIRNQLPILASKLRYFDFELLDGLAGQWLLGATPAGSNQAEITK